MAKKLFKISVVALHKRCGFAVRNLAEYLRNRIAKKIW